MVRLPAPHRAALAGALCLVAAAARVTGRHTRWRAICRLSDVMHEPRPGLPARGFEALAFAVGCALPAASRSLDGADTARRAPARSAIAAASCGVRGGEDRDAAEHDRDRRRWAIASAAGVVPSDSPNASTPQTSADEGRQRGHQRDRADRVAVAAGRDWKAQKARERRDRGDRGPRPKRAPSAVRGASRSTTALIAASAIP